ncbi:TonB family protein [candidate division GN15 bacterium]|nr:TonB family protein [candidate division GN15 bacterium]
MGMCRTYSPYGAWELKRNYQRNLLIANGLTVLIAVVLVAIPSMVTGPSEAGPTTVGPPPEPIETTINWSPPPVVTLEGPTVTTPGMTREELLGRIPTPVPDDQIQDDNVVIATRDEIIEWSNIYDPGDGGGAEFEGSGGSDVDRDFPAPDSFVSVEIEPKLIYQAMPAYPRLAKQAGIEGDVWVKVLVDIDGSVREAIIGLSSESAMLDEAAVAAAYRNRFSPAIQNGRPIPVWVTYKVEFRLNSGR